jgi:hypothetical protein
MYARTRQGELLFRTHGVGPRNGLRLPGYCTASTEQPSSYNVRSAQTTSQAAGRHAPDGGGGGSSGRNIAKETRGFVIECNKHVFRRCGEARDDASRHHGELHEGVADPTFEAVEFDATAESKARGARAING